MYSLQRSLDSIGFVEREKRNEKVLNFKCGRDFLYYALNYYYPEKFNKTAINPEAIDKERLFGITVPKYLAWTQIQFLYIASFLRKQGLRLLINNREIKSYVSFVYGNLISRISYEEAIKSIEDSINKGIACGIDISMERKWPYLLDHVMFVYGYDEENLYVFDTLTVAKLQYERISSEVHYYRLPKRVVKESWTLFGRVWRVEKVV